MATTLTEELTLNNFKTTELGDIPAEWEVVRLGDMCKLSKNTIEPQEYPNLRYVGLEHIESGSSKLRRWGDSSEVKSSKKVFVPDDVLYGKLRPYLDKAVLAEFEGVCSTDILVLKANSKITLPEILVNLLHSPGFLSHAINTTGGTNLPRTSWTSLKDFGFVLPPLAEQRKIAHVLNSIQRAIAAAQELKRSLMRRLFTYGPGIEPAPTRETEIGEAPGHWEVVRLGKVANIERGKFAHRPRNDPRFYGGKIPFIQTGDVAQANGRIATYSQTLNELGLSVSRMFPRGTIVITIAANIGYTGILDFDSAFPDSLIGITPNKSVYNVFLEYYLQTQQPEIDRKAPRGTQKNINIQFLKPWPVLKPPLDEQHQIAHILQTADAKIAAEQDRKGALQALFNSLLQALMSGRLRVNEIAFEGLDITGQG